MAKPAWLSISKNNGSGNGSFVVSANEHTGRVRRTGSLSVSGNGITGIQSVSVTQSPKAEFITLDESSSTVDMAGGTIILTGKSNSSKLTFAWKSGSSITTTIGTYTAGSKTASSGSVIPDDPGSSNQYNFSIKLIVPNNNNEFPISGTLIATTNNGISKEFVVCQLGIMTIDEYNEAIGLIELINGTTAGESYADGASNELADALNGSPYITILT